MTADVACCYYRSSRPGTHDIVRKSNPNCTAEVSKPTPDWGIGYACAYCVLVYRLLCNSGDPTAVQSKTICAWYSTRRTTGISNRLPLERTVITALPNYHYLATLRKLSSCRPPSHIYLESHMQRSQLPPSHLLHMVR